jgi:hypothetical protein
MRRSGYANILQVLTIQKPLNQAVMTTVESAAHQCTSTCQEQDAATNSTVFFSMP